MKEVIFYDYPDSALCIRCKFGEIHNQSNDGYIEDYGAICFLNSKKHNGTSCEDFELNIDARDRFDYLKDFEDNFDYDDNENEDL